MNIHYFIRWIHYGGAISTKLNGFFTNSNLESGSNGKGGIKRDFFPAFKAIKGHYSVNGNKNVERILFYKCSKRIYLYLFINVEKVHLCLKSFIRYTMLEISDTIRQK